MLHPDLRRTMAIEATIAVVGMAFAFLFVVSPLLTPAGVSLRPAWLPSAFGALMLVVLPLACTTNLRFYRRATRVLVHEPAEAMRVTVRKTWLPGDALEAEYHADLRRVGTPSDAPPRESVWVMAPAWPTEEVPLPGDPGGVVRRRALDGLVDASARVHREARHNGLVVVATDRGVLWPKAAHHRGAGRPD